MIARVTACLLSLIVFSSCQGLIQLSRSIDDLMRSGRGTTTRNVNVRIGPGTVFDKVGVFQKGTQVAVLSSENGWYQVRGAAGRKELSGFVSGKYLAVNSSTGGIGGSTTSALFGGSSPAPSASAAIPKLSTEGDSVEYDGYAADFQPIREKVLAGQVVDAANELERRSGIGPESSPEEHDLLTLLELGSLKLASGGDGQGIAEFAAAEAELADRSSRSIVGDGLRSGFLFLAETISGNEELGEYSGAEFERILILNFATIGYILNGERKAYNVTRRAAEAQRKARVKIEEERAEIERGLQEVKSKYSELSNGFNGESELSRRYKKYSRISRLPSSAYVSAFPDYLTGVVHEFESFRDNSMRDNARISYENASKLSPESSVIQAAVKAVKKPKQGRLLHVIVGEGFTPETKVLSFDVLGAGQRLSIRLPIYSAVSSPIERIEVHTSGGKRLARMSLVSDIESLAFAHQRDLIPLQTLRVVLAVGRKFYTDHLIDQIGLKRFSNWFNDAADSLISQSPDTRSWMTLPRRVYAARIVASPNLRTLKIQAYKKGGGRLGSKTVFLSDDGHAFVYGRAIGKNLWATASKPLWISKEEV